MCRCGLPCPAWGCQGSLEQHRGPRGAGAAGADEETREAGARHCPQHSTHGHTPRGQEGTPGCSSGAVTSQDTTGAAPLHPRGAGVCQ